MPESTGPGRDEDLGGDTSGRSTDIGSGSSHAEGADAPHRAFGSSTPGSDNPFSAEDANAASDATSPSGTPEDLKPGGDRPGLRDEEGAPAGDHGRETAPQAAGLDVLSVAWFVAGLAWALQISVDRAIGYGLRDRDGFQRGR